MALNLTTSIKLIGGVNMLLGIMAAFATGMNLLIAVLSATDQPDRFVGYALISSIMALFGMVDGSRMFRSGIARPWSMVAFGVTLMVFCGLLFANQDFTWEHHTWLALYGTFLVGFVTIGSARKPGNA